MEERERVCACACTWHGQEMVTNHKSTKKRPTCCVPFAEYKIINFIRPFILRCHYFMDAPQLTGRERRDEDNEEISEKLLNIR